MDGRWRRALREAANWVAVAGPVLLLVGTLGGAGVGYLFDPPPGAVTFVVSIVAALGSLIAFLAGFWRSYHRDDPPASDGAGSPARNGT